MSWASHEWKDGLPLKALHNIEELEKQHDRLRKELQQRQLQIETMEQVNTKQKKKFDIERTAQSALITDNKMLMETCEQQEKKRHRLEHELHMKEAQLLNTEEGYKRTKKQLEAESHKNMVLERQLEKLEGLMSVMEAQEKRSVTKIKMVKDMLQDQHWHDIAQITAEKNATSQLKVELKHVQNKFLNNKFNIKDKHNSDGDCNTTSAEAHPSHQSGDSAELMQLREKVVELMDELKAKCQQCQDVEDERDTLKEKFTGSLIIHQQQVTELSEKLRVLQAEHKVIVEQCFPQMSPYQEQLDKIDADKLPLPPHTQKSKTHRSPSRSSTLGNDHQVTESRSQMSNCSLDTKRSETEQLVSLATVEKLRCELDDVKKSNIRLTCEKAFLMKKTTKLKFDYIHMESQLVQLTQKSDSSQGDQSKADTQSPAELKAMKARYRHLVQESVDSLEHHRELMSMLQDKYNQALEKNTQLELLLKNTQHNTNGRKQHGTMKRRKLEYQMKEMKAEIAALKEKLTDSEILNDKSKRDIAEKRKNYMAETQSLNNKLKKVTLARDKLLEDLDGMTDRWKNLEQQVNSKVEMLTMFGEKLEEAERVASDLESKFEVKMRTVEAEQGRVETLKANLERTQASLLDITKKYDALSKDNENVCRKKAGREQSNQYGHMTPEQQRPHESLRKEAADVSGKEVGGGSWEDTHGKDRQVEELSDKLAQSEATVTQLRSKVNQLQDIKINGEMLINKKQQLVRQLEDQVKQDNSQILDLQRSLDRQESQLQDKEKALTVLRQRLALLESQLVREKDGVAQSTTKAAQEHQTLGDTVKTLQKEAASHEATVKDLKMRMENTQRLYQTQTEQCKKLEKEKENLEKTSGLLGSEKQNVDSKMQELASELATVREQATAMEAQQKQKIATLDAEIATLKKELSESVIQCEQQAERVKTLHTETEERKLNEELLRQQSSQQKDKAEKVSVMLESAEQERARLAGELQAARDECTAAVSQQTQLRSSSASLVSELKDHVSALEADNSTLQCQLRELGVKVDTKNDNVQRLTAAQLELNNKNEQLIQDHRRLMDVGQQLQAEIDQLKKACEEGSARVVALETQLEEGNRDWAGKLERADDALAAVTEKLRVSDIENDSLKMELSVTGRELEKRDGDRRVAEAKVADLVATSETLRQQMTTEREEKERLAAEVKELGSERDEIVGKVEMCEKELAEVKVKKVEAGCKSEALVASLKERLSAAEDEKALLQQELSQATLKLDGDAETAVATTRQLSQYKEQNEQLLQQIQESKDAVDQLKSVLSNLEQEMGNVAVKLAETEDELNTVKSAKEKLQCESTDLVEALQRRQKEAEDEKAALRMELDAAMAKLECSEGTSANTTHELSQFKEHSEQLLQQIQESKNAVKQLTSVLSSLEEEKGKIADKLAETEDELQTVKSAKEKLQCESTGLVEDLQRRQKEEEDKCIGLQAELQDAMSKLNSTEESIASFVCELSQSKEANEQLLQQNQESKDIVEQLKTMLSTLEEEKGKIAAELEDTKDELNTVKNAKEKLQCESTGLIEDLQRRRKEEEDEKMSVKTELEEALTKLDSNDESTASVVEELSQYKEHNEQLLQQIQENKNAVEQLTSVLSSLEEEKGKIAVKLEVTEGELNTVRSANEKLQCESTGLVEDLQRRQRETEDEMVALETELEEALAKLDSNEETAASVVQELFQYKECNEQLLQQNGESKDALDALQLKVALSEEASEKLAVELETVREELRSRSQEQEMEQCQSAGLIADLREQCRAVDERSAALQKDLQDALLKLDNGEEVMTGVVQELEAGQERETALLQQQDQLKQRLVAMETTTMELETEKATMAARCEQLEAELEAGRAEQAESRTRQEALIVELRERVNDADAEHKTMKDDADAAAFKLENLTEDLESLTEQLEESTARQTQLEQRCAELKASLDDVERHLEETEGEKHVALVEVERLQQTADSLAAEMTAKKAEEENVDTHVRQLESNTQRQQEELLTANDELNRLQVALIAQETRCSDLQQEKYDLANNLDAATRQVAHLEGEKAELLGSVERLEALIAASQANIDELRQEAVTAEETKVALMASLANQTHCAEKAQTDARQEVEEIQVKLRIADIEHTETTASHAQIEADLESRIEKLQTNIADCQTENGSLLARVKEAEFLLATACQEKTSLQAEMEKNEADMTALLGTHAAEMTHTDKLEEGLQAELSGLHMEIGRFEGDLAKSQDHVSKLEQQLLTAQEEMSCSVNAQLSAENEHDRERAALQKCISELEAAVSKNSRQVATLENDIQTAKTSADCFESELQVALQAQVGNTREVESKLKELEIVHAREIDSLVSEHVFKLATYQEEMDTLRQEVEKLCGELQARSDQLQRLHTEYTSELATAKRELDEASMISETRNGELGRLKEELEDVRGALGKRERELKAVADDLAGVKVELGARTEELEQVKFVGETQVTEMEGVRSKLEAQLRVAYDCGEDTEQQLSDRTDEIVVLNQRIASLEASVAQSDVEKNEIKEQCQMLCAEKDRIVVGNEKQHNNHQVAVSELERQLCEAREQTDDSGIQLGMLHDSVSALERALSTEEERHTRERADLASKIQQLENDVKEKQGEVDRVQSELDVALAAVDEHTIMAQSKSADLSCALREMEQKSQEQQRQHENQLAELQVQLEFAANAAESEKVALQNELSTVRDQLHKTKDMIHVGDVKHSQMIAELDAEVSRLAMTVDHLEQQAVVSEEQLSAAKLETAARREELLAARERIKSQTEKSDHLGSVSQQEKECDQEKLRLADELLSKTEEKLAAANKDNSALEQRLSEAVTTQAQLRQRIASLEASVVQSDVKKNEIKEQCQMLCAEKDRIVVGNQKQHNNHQVAVSELERQLCEAREQTDDSGIQLGMLHDSVSALERALSTEEERHTRERADLPSKIQQLENDVKEKQGEVDRVQSELDVALAAVDERAVMAQSKSADLSCVLREMEQKSQEQQRQHENQLAELQAQLEFAANAAESEKVALQNELSTVRDQLHKTKDTIHAGDVKHSQMMAELDAEVSRLTMTVDYLEQQAVVSEEQLSAAKLETAARREELLAARERIKSQTEESDHLGSVSQQEKECDQEKLRLADELLSKTEEKLAAANKDNSALEQQLSEAVTTQVQLRQQIVSLEGSTEQAAVKSDDQLALIENLRQQIEDVHTRMESEASRLNHLIEELQLQLSQVSEQETERVDRYGETESVLATKEEKLVAAEDRVTELQRKLSEAGTVEAQLRQQVSSLEACREQRKLEREEQEAALGDLTERHDRFVEQYNCDVTNLRQAIATLEKRLQEKRELIEEIERELREQREGAQDLETMLQDAQTSAAEANHELALTEKTLALDKADAEVLTLRSDIDKADSEISVLRSDVDKANTEISTLKLDVDKADAEILTLTLDINKANAEISTLRSDNDKANAEISTLRSDNDKANAEISTLRSDNDKANAEISTLRSDNDKANAEISTLRSDIDKADAEISTLRSDVDSARTDAEAAHGENTRLHHQLEAKQMECGALAEQLQELHEQLEELSEQKSQYCEQLCELQSHLSTVCSEKDAAVHRCETVQAEHLLFQEVSTQVDAEQEQLRSTMEQLRCSVERLEREKCEREMKAEESEELLQVIQVEAEGLQAELDDCQRTSHDLQASVETLQAERDAAVSVSAGHQEALASREVEVAALQKELRENEGDWESKSQEIEELGRTVGRLEREVGEGVREARRLEERCGAALTARDDCLAELDSTQAQCSTAMEQVRHLEAAAVTHMDDVDALTADLTAMRTDNDRLRRELTQLMADAMTAQTEITQKLADARCDLDTRHQDIVTLKQHLSDEQSQGETLQVKCADLEHQVELLKQDKAELEHQLAQLGDQMELLGLKKAELQVGNEEVISRSTALETKVTQMGEELSNTKVSLEAKQQELEQLQSKVELLEHSQLELEQLRSKVKLLEHTQEELVQLRNKLKLLEQGQEELEQLQGKVKLLEHSQEDLEQLRSKVNLLEHTQEELMQLRNKLKLMEHAQQELEQLRNKLKLLEQGQEELEQLQGKVKLLEHAQEELEQLRNSAQLLAHTQAELAVLKKELDDASLERLLLKEESDTQRTCDDEVKVELAQKTKDADVWRSRFQSLLQRYHLVEEENDTLKDKLEGPVAVAPPRSRICTRQSASTKQPSQSSQESRHTKKRCHEIITSESTPATTEGPVAAEQPRSRICMRQSVSTKQQSVSTKRQSVSTKRPSQGTHESHHAKKMCHDIITCESTPATTVEKQEITEGETERSQSTKATKLTKEQTPKIIKATQSGKHRQIRRIARIQPSSAGVTHTSSLNAKALAIITNSPKKVTCPVDNSKTGTKSATLLSSPATRCLRLKKTPERLSRRRLEPSTEASDNNSENCEVQ